MSVISEKINLLTDEDLAEIKRKEWGAGFEHALNSRMGDFKGPYKIMGLTLTQIRYLARNYQRATGKDASTITAED